VITPSRPRLSRRRFLAAVRNVVAGYALAGAGGYLYGSRIEAEWLTVRRLTLPIRSLPAAADGLRLVQLSDFHLRPVTEIDHIRRAVSLASSLQPDVIVLTGDYVTIQAEDIFELAPVLGGLNARLGVFTVLGNHDLWTNRRVVTQGLHEAGLPVLINQGLAVGGLYLAGLDDAWSGAPDLAQALAGCPAGMPAVLLAHEPDFVDEWSRDPRVAVQLSGHSHGGQVRLPGLGAVIVPPYGRKYDYGLYQVHHTRLYTNPGIGLAVPGVRVNCRPEVTEITLTQGA